MAPRHITLNDGTRIPQLGLGVFKARDGEETTAVKHALGCGYRHIDTAAAYRNEEGVGRGMRDSGVARDEIYLTSKIWNEDIRTGRTTDALEQSLMRLGTDHLNLILLHWPTEGRVAAFKALLEAKKAGKVLSVGVSNFLAPQLDELVSEAGDLPSLNQIEYHPYLQQQEITAACQRHGVAVEAWSPLMQGRFMNEPLFASIGEAHGKTQAQVLLRWNIQRGIIVIPKSVTPARIEENFDLFDFTLDDEEMKGITALERGKRFGPDPANFNF